MSGGGTGTPSPDEVMAAKGANGYWPKEQLLEWGIPVDPVPARWREGLERKWHEEHIPDEVRHALLAAGYDEEGVQTAWRSYWHPLGQRLRMYEVWWKNPEDVRTVLRELVVETELTHPRGAAVILRVPVDIERVGEKAIAALEKLGWARV